MTDDIRLLALTHLRAALEMGDWRQVVSAGRLLKEADAASWNALVWSSAAQSWRGVEWVYVSLGGVGAGVATLGPISGGSSRAEGQAA